MQTIKELRSSGWISVKEASEANRVSHWWIHRQARSDTSQVEFRYGPNLRLRDIYELAVDTAEDLSRARRYVNAEAVSVAAEKRRIATKARECDFNGRKTDRPEDLGEWVRLPRRACPGCGKDVAYRDHITIRGGLIMFYGHKDPATGWSCDTGGAWGWFLPEREPGESNFSWDIRVSLDRAIYAEQLGLKSQSACKEYVGV